MAKLGVKMKTKNNTDKPIYQAPTTKKSIKVASEPDEVEVIDIPSVLDTYPDWKKENPGKSYDDFLEENGLKRKKLNSGGVAEDYADLIDAYEKGIDVMEGESLTQYIKRIKAAEKD